ncbi:MAG: hypothetical protein WBA93_22680 [Microcoleaceae cyanobacterium]
MINKIMRRLTVVSGLVILNALGFATVARAGEGGIAGSAAFTVDAGNVTGVAVSAAVGKENASAAAFNYDTGGAAGLQNSAWALGSAGIQAFTGVGDPLGFGVTPTADADKANPQTNTFTEGTVTVQIGTTGGDAVVEAP